MKVVEINSVEFGSTGKIARQITELANNEGIDAYFAYPKSRRTSRLFGGKKPNSKDILIGTIFGKVLHEKLSYITGLDIYFSFFDTLFFIKRLKKIKPDIVHLHNLHGYYINIPLLFKYLKKSNVQVIWTLHDCWSFTGRCPYFDLIKCNKWKSSCYDCQYSKNLYPKVKFNFEYKLFLKKKKIFSSLKNLTIVTPSNWLSDLVKSSFLGKYKTIVINNGIDLSVFKVIRSNVNKYNIPKNKIIIGGVASPWCKRKGLDFVIKLANDLPNQYQIVLVGTNEEVDKIIPNNIISIHRTDNQIELAKLYNSFDLLINPTLEDNYPTVNMESISCNTPVITFDTGGSSESVSRDCGIVVSKGNYKLLLGSILNFDFKKYKNCSKVSYNFRKEDKFKLYINLFRGKKF